MRVQNFMNEKFEVNNISAIMHHELIKSNSKDIMLHKIYISSKFVLLNSTSRKKIYHNFHINQHNSFQHQ